MRKRRVGKMRWIGEAVKGFAPCARGVVVIVISRCDWGAAWQHLPHHEKKVTR